MISSDDYVALITSEHRSAPNFVAFVRILVQPFVDAMNQFQALVSEIDLDLAAGAQLDLIGQWVGLPRILRVPIAGVYFSFDTAGLGFDQGVWQSSQNPNAGVTTLDDETYRTMLRAKIASNSWDGSLGQANALLGAIFPGNQVFIKDNFDMTESVIVNGSALSNLFQQLVTTGYLSFKPSGVGLV